MLVVARQGCRFLVDAHDGAQALDEVGTFKAHRFPRCKFGAIRFLGLRWWRHAYIDGDCRVVQPPAPFVFGLDENLVGPELDHLPRAQAILAHAQVLDFLAQAQALADRENPDRIL